VRADLDTLAIALYCAACALFPSERTHRRSRPELISVSARFQVNDFEGVLASRRARGGGEHG